VNRGRPRTGPPYEDNGVDIMTRKIRMKTGDATTIEVYADVIEYIGNDGRCTSSAIVLGQALNVIDRDFFGPIYGVIS